MHVRTLTLGVLLLASTLACSQNATKPAPIVKTPLEIFYEPPSFCSRSEAGSDTLAFYNLGDSTVVLTLAAPDWVEGLPSMVEIPPDHMASLGWSWGKLTLPLADSILAEDATHRIAVPIRLHAPTTPDVDPPDDPLLAIPEDEAVFSLRDTIAVCWSRIADCSTVHYRIEVARNLSFDPMVFSSEEQTQTCLGLEPDKRDRGISYWRIRVTDGTGCRAYSKTRSWTIQ